MRNSWILIIAIVYLPSCVQTYGVVSQSFETTKFTIPYSGEADTSAIYAGASYERYAGVNNSNPYNVAIADNDYYTANVNVHYAKQAKGYYYASGITAFKGVYQLNSFPVERVNGDLSLWGLGVSGETGLSLKADNINYRPVGLKFSGLVEKGEYAQFRNNWLDTNISNVTYINSNENDLIINVSLTGGLTYQTDHFQLGVDFLLGVSNEKTPFGVTTYLSYKRLHILLNLTRGLSYGMGSFHGGVGYRF